jgi:hypothetical protein
MGAWDEFETPENETPQYWNPETPEKVRGTIVKFDTFKDDEGNTHPQVLLDVDGTTVTVTGFRKLLRDALLNLVKVEGAKEGDVAEVEFKGKAQGKRYYLYDAKLIGDAPKREVDAKEEF